MNKRPWYRVHLIELSAESYHLTKPDNFQTRVDLGTSMTKRVCHNYFEMVIRVLNLELYCRL
jgi:hypothetical protein